MIHLEGVSVKKIASYLIFLASCLFIIPLSAGQKKISPKDLPEQYRVWLEEEVVYIITPKEKEVFLQLETDRERNLFTEAFWKQRDPTPNTLENEFKDEHYRRISYANKFLGRGTPTVGWRTEQGRIYIILGEPKAIERYENYSEVYPTITWFYQGMGQYGLPNTFNVVFIKKFGAGDYELYSPIMDGPQTLLVHYLGDPKDYMMAYYQLREVQPDLARVSLSLLPEEPLPSLSPTVASEILLSNISVKPQKAVKDAYAEKLLKYKDIIEVEYSANYMDSDYVTSVIQDQSGITYVHYLIEPKNLSVDFYEDTYSTTLEISAQVTDLNGKTIYQFNKEVPIRFNESQRQRIQALPFSFQDAFPMVEGHYKFSVLLKNRVSKEFTSLERDLIIPSFQSPEEMTSLILAPHTTKISPASTNKPFSVGDIRLYPSPRKEFSINDNLYVFFQIPGLSEELKETGRLVLSIYKQEQEILKREKALKDYMQKDKFIEEFSLKEFPPAHYRVEVKVLSKENTEILLEMSYFSVSFAEAIPRSFIYSDYSLSPEDPMTDYVLGGQYYNKGEFAKASSLLERAYHKAPESLLFTEGFSRILYQSGQFEEVKNMLLPFVQTSQKEYRFLKQLGEALQKLEQYEEAIGFFKQYLAYYGTNLEVLNAVGICYLEMGNKEEALIALEKSLEINPDQEQIKKLVSEIKEIK